jgi:glycosyltransferase involved in cell wall biosynthesis
MKRVSVVMPAYNEAACLRELVTRLSQVAAAEAAYRFDFLFIDDGSADETLATLRELRATDERVRYVSLSRNFGHQAALSAGLDHADGDAIVFLDADLQHPPELIAQLLREWEKGAQVVNTVRQADPGLGMVKRASSAGFYWLINLLANIRVQPDGADFRLLDRSAADGLRQVRERSRFIRGLVQWIGYRQTVIDYKPDKRFAGRSRFSPMKMLRLALDGIYSFTNLPLQLATFLGLSSATGAFVYAMYALYLKLVAGTAIQGWTSLLLVVLLMGGVQLVTLGILGAYVARIYEEVRGRPIYLVKESADRPDQGSTSEQRTVAGP